MITVPTLQPGLFFSNPLLPDPGSIVQWQRAYDLPNTISGTSVVTWSAHIGNHSLTAGSTNPKWIKNHQNNLPVVRFNGSTDAHVTTPTINTGQGYSFAIAFQYSGSTGLSAILSCTNVDAYHFGTAFDGNFISGQVSATADLAPLTNSFSIMVICIEGSGEINYSFNGGALVSTGRSFGSIGNAFGIGYDGNNGTGFSQVDIGEFVVWNTDESNNVGRIYSYFYDRWFLG